MDEPRRDKDGQPLNDKGIRICGAKKLNGPGWCGLQAGHRTDHPGYGPCSRHMGRTPMVTKGAFRQMARSMGDPIHINPADGMAATIAATAGHVAWLERKVAEFRFSEKTRLDEDGVETEVAMTPNQKQWWAIYGEERDRLIKYSEVAIRAGLAERSVRLAEKQGEMLSLVVDKILDGLGLTDEQLLRVPDVVPAAMRSVEIEVLSIEPIPNN